LVHTEDKTDKAGDSVKTHQKAYEYCKHTEYAICAHWLLAVGTLLPTTIEIVGTSNATQYKAGNHQYQQ
jgi:hypothetical protein